MPRRWRPIRVHRGGKIDEFERLDWGTAMIVDGHAYCFPSPNERLDPPSDEDPLRHLQREMGIHHQPAWRTRDRDPAGVDALIDLGNWETLGALKEADFRAAGFGRFEWRSGGEVIAKQYQPPSMQDMAYPPERLVAEMDYADIEWALLHKFQGTTNDYMAACVREFPQRLRALAHVAEWRVADDPDAAIAEVTRAITELKLSGLQFMPYQMDLHGHHEAWDGPEYRPFWDAVADLGVPVYLTLLGRREPAIESYRNELRTLERWMERYPDTTVVHTHGFPWRMYIDGDRVALPDYVWEPFANQRLHLQLLFPISLGNVWDYPMGEVQPVIETCVSRIGARRLIWGTDMPMVMRFWTYRQNVDFIGRHCRFLADDDCAAILGGTAARLMNVPGAGSTSPGG